MYAITVTHGNQETTIRIADSITAKEARQCALECLELKNKTEDPILNSIFEHMHLGFAKLYFRLAPQNLVTA